MENDKIFQLKEIEVTAMKKAENINEFANNLIPENFLKPEDKNVYVPIYEDILEALRDMVINDQVEAQSFFVAGQPGTGKTTALNFFPDKTVEEHFHVKYINMRDFLDLSDVDVIDFLLAFAFAMVKNTQLEKNYYQKLVDIQRKHKGEIEETVERESDKTTGAGVQTEGSAGGGFLNFIKLKAGFFSHLKLDRVYREKTREIFKLKKPFLRDLVNELLEDYIEKVSKGKRLLVIIDDLDKLKEVPQINSIFIDNRNYIFSLKCKKIISIPTYLSKVPEIFNYSQYPIRQFVLRLSPNPFNGEPPEKEKEKIEANKQMLRKVIRSRTADGFLLIDKEALEEAIHKSGGIIRQLIRIVYVAAVNVRRLGGVKISINDIQEGIDLLRNNLAGTIISSDKIAMLNTILTENIPISETAREFIDLLQANNVVAYENGEPWYEVNPIIRGTVKVYAARQPKE
jgi:DNA polymerase III delta prime subunit